MIRLRRLDLIRYGHFQNAVLDFGPAAGGPDVTIVYGDNEAGKSTAYSAWLDFLFGLPNHTTYAVGCERRDMVIGAEIETSDGAMTLRRTGAATGSLTDAAGHAVAEHRLAGWLYGLDRAAYCNRFSLDDAILRKGGETIARAQGDLGQLLHAGTSGLAGLAEALDRIEEEGLDFYRKGGSKNELNRAKKRLKEIDGEIRARRVDPRDFDRLTAEVACAEAAFATADAELQAAARRLRLRRAAEARHEFAKRIRNLDDRIAACPQGPDLPAGAVGRVAGAEQRRADAARSEARARAARSEAQDRLDAIAADPTGLRVGEILAALEAVTLEDGQPLLTRVVSNEADLPRRRRERDAILAQLRAIAAEIAGAEADPAELLMPKPLLAALRDRVGEIREKSAAHASLAQTRREAERALGDPVEAPVGLAALEEALEAWHRQPDDLPEAERQAAEAASSAEDAAAGLPPGWHAIAAAGLPEAAEITALVARHDRLAQARDRVSARVEAAMEAVAAAQAEREAICSRPDAVLDGDIARSRAERDAAWSRHRGAVSAETAVDFEQAMRADDALRDRHAASADLRAAHARLTQEIVRRESDRERHAQALAEAAAAVAEAAAGLAAIAGTLGLGPDAPPEALAPRRDRLAAALGAERASARAAEALRAVETRRERLAEGLRAAVATAGGALPGPGAAPGSAAERLRAALREQQRAAENHAAKQDAVAGIACNADRAGADLAAAEAALAASLSGLWCAGHGAEALAAILPGLAAMADLDADRRDLAHRIAGMEAAFERFLPWADELGALLGLADDATAVGLLASARDRARQAAERARALAGLEATIAEAEAAIREAEIDARQARAQIEAILAGQEDAPGAALADPVGFAESLASRDQLRQKRTECAAAWQDAGIGHDPAALAEEEAEDDPLRTTALEAAVERAKADRDAALIALTTARERLAERLKAAGGADADQERATILETLRDQAAAAASRQIGLMAARSALRRFRQDRRSDMLTATEDAFAHMTGGAWPGLTIQPHGAQERLFGLQNGAPVAVDAMSTGTQGQLYLALRIAGHADFLRENGPLPFITDDVHETFDDGRARAALELAARMGEIGQAILFTHHRHLADLAREAIPGVGIVELVPQAARPDARPRPDALGAVREHSPHS